MLLKSWYYDNCEIISSPDPTHSRAQKNIAYFDHLIKSDPDQYVNVDKEREGERERESPETREKMSDYEKYESLCRGPWTLVSHTHNTFCVVMY